MNPLAFCGTWPSSDLSRFPPNYRESPANFHNSLDAHNRLVTDKLRSYGAVHRVTMPPVHHCTNQYANNRVGVSHQPIPQEETPYATIQMFRTRPTALSFHSSINGLFRIRRQRKGAPHPTSHDGSPVVCFNNLTNPVTPFRRGFALHAGGDVGRLA